MRTTPIVPLLLGLAATVAHGQQSARLVKYHANGIVSVHAKMRYTMLIELPSTEKILEVATGDKDFWIIDTVGNYCFLHPAKDGIRSAQVSSRSSRTPLIRMSMTRTSIRTLITLFSAFSERLQQRRFGGRPITNTRVAPHFRVGLVLLAGDAAHLNSPAGELKHPGRPQPCLETCARHPYA